MHQLVSSQLDLDRLDYLKRDSFYSGATEGNINTQQLLQCFNVVDDKLVIEERDILCEKDEKCIMAYEEMPCTGKYIFTRRA